MSKNIKHTNIRPPEPQKVVFWATNEKRTRGASPGLVFWVHRKSEGRRGSRARLAQWLGARRGGGRNRAVPGSIPPSRAFSKTLTKLDVWAPEARKPTQNSMFGPQKLQKSCFGRGMSPKVVFWARNEKGRAGLARGLYFGCIGNPRGGDVPARD